MAAKFQFESTAITALASQYDVIIIGYGNNRIGGNSIAETVIFGRQAEQQVYRDSMTS
ncbi:hypothetical protein [Lactiplantibacillus paraxiangfangensis]|uniref:hypothetical protein n=1 Tax=Lactiplantibacillus paraxiangfangensis TaxID=3076224 RepID=UPI0030C752DC